MYKYDKYIHAGLKIEFAGAHKDEMFTADRHVCAYVRARARARAFSAVHISHSLARERRASTGKPDDRELTLSLPLLSITLESIFHEVDIVRARRSA